jgi:hypothetical protein
MDESRLSVHGVAVDSRIFWGLLPSRSMGYEIELTTWCSGRLFCISGTLAGILGFVPRAHPLTRSFLAYRCSRISSDHGSRRIRRRQHHRTPPGIPVKKNIYICCLTQYMIFLQRDKDLATRSVNRALISSGVTPAKIPLRVSLNSWVGYNSLLSGSCSIQDQSRKRAGASYRACDHLKRTSQPSA